MAISEIRHSVAQESASPPAGGSVGKLPDWIAWGFFLDVRAACGLPTKTVGMGGGIASLEMIGWFGAHRAEMEGGIMSACQGEHGQ